VYSADPVDEENDFGSFSVDVGDHFTDDRAHDALLEASIYRRRRPDGFEILEHGVERKRRDLRALRDGGIMGRNLRFDLAGMRKRAVPAQLQFRRDETVRRIRDVVLSEGPIDGVTCSVEIAHERRTHLIVLADCVRLSFDSCRDRSWLDDLKKRLFDRIIDRINPAVPKMG
jgi:hypothetical protein